MQVGLNASEYVGLNCEMECRNCNVKMRLLAVS